MCFSRNLRVLQAIRQGTIGGGETHVMSLVQTLNKELYTPIVLSFTHGPMVEQIEKMGIKAYVIPTEKPFNVLKWAQVKKLMEDEKIDLLHAHGTRAASNTFWAAKQLGLPIIYTVHGWSFHIDQNPLVMKSRQLGEKWLLKYSDSTICVSESNLKDGLSFSKMDGTVVIKNGIDLQTYNPLRVLNDIKAELGIPKEMVLVGYIARITAQKDPLTLVRAIALIPSSLPLMFLLVGDGDLKPAVVQLAKDLKVSSRILFLDARQDIPEILQAIDIYCLPSLWEGLSIGLLEAMSMGKAVVATAIDGTKEVVKNNINGLLIPPNAPDRLAEVLIELAIDSELRLALGSAARQTIQNEYSLEVMTRGIEHVYQKTLSKSVQKASASISTL